MKSIKTIIIKFVMLITIIILLLSPICISMQKYYNNILMSSIFQFDSSIKTLIIGDSHAETAINPKMMHYSKNLARSGENYFWNYYKLKHLLAINHNISTIILSFSWHNFPKKYQEGIVYNPRFGNVDQYFLLLDERGRSTVEKFDGSYIITWLKYNVGIPFQLYLDNLYLRNLLGVKISEKEINFFGGYLDIAKTEISKSSIDGKLSKYYYEDNEVSSESLLMIEYVNKIIKLCADRKIKIILLNTPVHALYRNSIPSKSINIFDKIKSEIMIKYNNIEYIDYSSLNFPDEFYSDGDHVNRKGALSVTTKLQYKLFSSYK